MTPSEALTRPPGARGSALPRDGGGGRVAQAVASNAVWIVAGRFAAMALSGVISVLVARHLGAEDFGRYALVYAYVAMFGWISTFGLENILIRDTAAARQRGDQIFSAGVTLSGLFAAVAFLMALAGTYLMSYESELRLPIVLAGVEMLLLQPFNLRRYIFRVELQQWIGVLADNAVQLLRLALFSGLIGMNAGLLAFVSTKLLCGVIFAVAISVLAGRFVRIRWRADPATARSLLSGAWPLGLAALGGIVLTRLDYILIHGFLDARALGLYAASWTLVQFLGVFPNALMASIFPVMSRYRDDPRQLHRLARLGFRYSILVIFPVAVAVTLWADEIMALLYGDRFTGGGVALAILIWAMPSSFFGAVLRDTVIVMGRQQYLLTMSAIQLVACVPLSLWLIPRWGLTGAAVAAATHPFLAVVVAPALMRGTRELTMIGVRQLIAPGVACLGIALLGRWESLPPALGLTAGLLAYTVLLLVFRGLDHDDLRHLRSAVARR